MPDKFTYSVREERRDGESHFFADFVNGDGIRQETEITREIYKALEDCRKCEQRIIRSDERHLERSLLSDEQLVERAVKPPVHMEKAVSFSLDLQAALPLLTETQRRRFLLCHEYGLRYEQIAGIEGCSIQAVAKAISTAKEQLKKFFFDEG